MKDCLEVWKSVLISSGNLRPAGESMKCAVYLTGIKSKWMQSLSLLKNA